MSESSLLIEHLKSYKNINTEFDLYDKWYTLIPSMKFTPDNNIFNSGYIEYHNISEITEPILNENDWESCGAIIAMYAMFGITDLHFENILFGKNSDNKIVFCALDIESIFNKIGLLSQTHLLPFYDLSENICGLKKIKDAFNLKPKNKFLGALVFGYLTFMDKYKEVFLNILNNNFFHQIPIRVIIRSTNFYNEIIQKKSFNFDNIYPEEKEQILRKDIPYFFRYINSRDIFYYSESKKNIKFSHIRNNSINQIREQFVTSNTDIKKISNNLLLLKKTGAAQLIKFFNQEKDFFIYKNTRFYLNCDYIKIEYRNNLWIYK
ncbi:hypothetical protein [Silvanigrella paludirubra]|uniref:hypothetical protein n=1 Tax=Silvanigrella paludirubra TaxID=2499159 RepID=UPI001F3C3020|nr:hypothetical protein [Silvanigrella paludirubra]